MRGHGVFLALLLICSAVAVGTPTAAAQSAPEPDDWTAEDVIDIITSTNASQAATDQVQAVAEWLSDPENIQSLSSDQTKRIREWVTAAATERPSFAVDLTAIPGIGDSADGSPLQQALTTAGSTLPADASAADIRRVQTALQSETTNLTAQERERLQTWVEQANQYTSGEIGPTTQRAQLAVAQPEYRGDVSTAQETGETVYIITGRSARIQPQNFDSEAVLGFGTTGEVGELTYDQRMDEFEFDSGGAVGTVGLYWEVEERVASENGTETVRQRYTATIRADSNRTYEHIAVGELDGQRSDAANWSAWESAVQSIAGDDADIESQTSIAQSLLRLRHDPLSALSGQFTAQLLALFLTLGGLLVLLLFGGLHLLSRYSDIAYINREETRKAEERDLDEKLREHDWREKMDAPAKWDWNDWLGDYSARAYRSVAETPFKGLKRLLQARRPKHLVTHRVKAMGHDGYVGVTDDVAADGGSGAATSAQIVHERDVGDEMDTVDLTDPDEAFIDALDWESQTLWNYDLASSDAHPEQIAVEEAPMDLDELIEQFGAEVRGFESTKHWGQYLLEFIEYVDGHEFTDDYGRPDDVQFVLSEWMDTDDFLADAFDIPHLKYESDALEWAVKHSDPVKEADNRVERARQGRDPDA